MMSSHVLKIKHTQSCTTCLKIKDELSEKESLFISLCSSFREIKKLLKVIRHVRMKKENNLTKISNLQTMLFSFTPYSRGIRHLHLF